MENPEFIYTTFINTTPEKLWQALTEPAFTREYWGGLALISDWKAGSPVHLQYTPDSEPEDHGQVVLEAEPYHKLSYSWHRFQPAHAEVFGWTESQFAEHAKEPQSKVTFLIEKTDRKSKLTVMHNNFEPGSTMHKAISGQLKESGGWPELLSDLKTLLETGKLATI